MTHLYYDKDADLSFLQNKRVAILGYGSQGHAHALNLHDNGVDVRVGLRGKSASAAKATQAGLRVQSVSEVSSWANVILFLVPDGVQPEVFERHVRPQLTAGDTLVFAHGFNVHFGHLDLPQNVDVVLVAPKSPGHRVRETFQDGKGVPSLFAIHQDPSGEAEKFALSYATGLGSGRAGILRTTFAEETETDLFGEQAVLCGGVSELVKAGFETLVDAGYQPEVAYFECLHELKLIVDLMVRGGLSFMRHSISDTAEYGDYQSGRRVISKEVRENMAEILKDIQSGQFAKDYMEECRTGGATFERHRASERNHPIEKVGSQLREAFQWTT
jgi:ketol-acid reductoisomerase